MHQHEDSLRSRDEKRHSKMMTHLLARMLSYKWVLEMKEIS